MNRGLLWLALADLRQSWLRSGLATLAIAVAILAVAFFAGQIQLHQSEVLANYEAAGAATFIVQLTGVADVRIVSEVPCFFGGSCRIASPALISDRITAQHIGIRWFWPGYPPTSR